MKAQLGWKKRRYLMLAEMLSIGVLGASWKESWGPMWSSPRSSLFWSSPSVAGSPPGCSPPQGWRSSSTPKPWLVLGPIQALPPPPPRHFYLCFVLVFAALRGWGLVWLPGDTLSLSQVMRTVLQPNSSPSTGASVGAGPTHSQQYLFFIGRNTRLQLHVVVYS